MPSTIKKTEAMKSEMTFDEALREYQKMFAPSLEAGRKKARHSKKGRKSSRKAAKSGRRKMMRGGEGAVPFETPYANVADLEGGRKKARHSKKGRKSSKKGRR